MSYIQHPDGSRTDLGNNPLFDGHTVSTRDKDGNITATYTIGLGDKIIVPMRGGNLVIPGMVPWVPNAKDDDDDEPEGEDDGLGFLDSAIGNAVGALMEAAGLADDGSLDDDLDGAGGSS